MKYDWVHSDIETLLHSQGMEVHNNMSRLPKFGITLGLPMTTTPVAAGFLRMIEGSKNTAMLDSLITNAHINPDIRNAALDDLVSKLIIWATEHDIINILAFSVDKNTLMRAKRFGFEELPHQLIALTLTS